MMKDREYMSEALRLAAKGRGKTSPNPMVGALIVNKGKIVGQGWHRRCGGKHAEVYALRQAGDLARGAKLYVTLEPCFHVGRTPPCVDQVILAGIREIVIGMRDPNPLTRSKSIRKLRRAGIQVKVGCLEQDCRNLNEVFCTYITEGRPFVCAKTAQSLDGKIALVNGRSKWITSYKTRAFSHRMRNDFDAILVGINTVLKDDPRLDAVAPGKRIVKIVLDTKARVPTHARLFKGTQPHQCILAVTAKAFKKDRARLEANGADVIVCPTLKGQVDIKWLLNKLAKREISSVLIEGGATVVGSALQQRVVDKMNIFIAKKIIGSQDALSSVRGVMVKNVNKAIKLKQTSFVDLGRDFFVQGKVQY